MKLALVTPYYFPSVRGNSITVQRIATGLRDLGVEVGVYSLDRQDRETILAAMRRALPDAIHGFHATASGPLVAEAVRTMRVPAAITLTGTDVNQDLCDAKTRPLVRDALGAARAIVTFHETIAATIRREAPDLACKVRVIGQSVLCDGPPYDLRAALGLHPGDFVFFQPAGIRRVKNIPAVLPPLATLQRDRPVVKYVLAGPAIEAEEATRVTTMLRGLPWATYLGAVDHDRICAALPAVQAVVNSSRSEGGMPNAVLEAMSKGVPVLASDIEGHRSVIADGEDGFLFASPEEFLVKARRLLDDPALRVAMGHRARMKIGSQFRPDVEIGKHLALYRDLVGGG